MAFEYGSENRWYDQYFGKNVTVAAGGTECPERLAVGEHHGALAVTVAAAVAGTVTNGTITLLDSDQADCGFAVKDDAPVLTIKSAAPEAGDIIAKMVLPDCKRYVGIKLGGTMPNCDVFLSYLAR